MSIKAAVLTVSDRCSAGLSEDRSGPLLSQCLSLKGFVVVEQSVVPDERQQIQEILENWCDFIKVDLIITTGGTGFTARDITPEVTKSLIDREATAISVALITESLKLTPMAMLSRLTSGIRKSTLIVNFPGSAKACKECFGIIEPIIQHAIDQLRNNVFNINQTHNQLHHNHKSKVELVAIASRPRTSQYQMISMNSAINIIMSEISGINTTETVSINDLDKLIGSILAEDVSPTTPLPPFPASVKDGYAVIAEDGSGPRKLLPISATAGNFVKSDLISGFCARISTGAAVPNGANAVVQVEDTKVLEQTETGEESVILIEKSPKIGQDIRPIGCDIKADGKPILNRYNELGPIELGLLASIGVNKVTVFKRPIVAVLSTGDEIINPGQQLLIGSIWDSNRTTLLSLLKQISIKTIDLGIAKDDINDIYNKIRIGLSEADIIITTGGVSMGEKDLLKQIIETDFNAKIHFGRINLKPGKPTTFATCFINEKKKFIFALPGNPVSAFVTFHLYVKPAIFGLSGRQLAADPIDILTNHKTLNVEFKADREYYDLDDRPEFARAVITYGQNIPIASIIGNQRSSRLMSAKEANALVLLPQKSDQLIKIRNGDIIKAILL